MGAYQDTLASFDIDSIPNLDIVVRGALELLSETKVPDLDFTHLQDALVLGSGNAALTAQIIFDGKKVTFGDESSYRKLLEQGHYDGVVVFSASGKKHAIDMVTAGKEAKVRTYLVTNTESSEAGALLNESHVFTFPKNREPYTYNTSTYFSPIFGKTGEDAGAIASFIETDVSPKLLRNFGDYDAYTLIIPSQFEHARAMLRTKFDELFGPMINGRVFTEEEIKHAKTVVPSGNELFISFGVANEHYGLVKNRLFVPLPSNAGYGAMLAIGYFVIGRMQEAYPPYFARSIVQYTETASKIFDQTINPIVE